MRRKKLATAYTHIRVTRAFHKALSALKELTGHESLEALMRGALEKSDYSRDWSRCLHPFRGFDLLLSRNGDLFEVADKAKAK